MRYFIKKRFGKPIPDFRQAGSISRKDKADLKSACLKWHGVFPFCV